MNRSVVMIMGGAVVVAIIVAMLVQMKISPKAPAEKPVAGTEVLVAVKALEMGDNLKPEDVRWQSIPDNVVFSGMVKKKDQADEKKLDVYGKPLRRDIMSGEPITTQSLIMDAANGGSFLSATMTPGMRAVGIPVRAETSVGGFVTPGDYVDVILTYTVSLRGDAENYSDSTVQRYASETILSNVRVLAIDQTAKEGDRSARVSRTVTLEVTKSGAQVLAMSSSMGTLSLALRRVGEKDSARDAATPPSTDLQTSRVMQKIYRNMGDSKTVAGSVRVYNGSAVTNVPVRVPADPKKTGEQQ